MYFEKKQKTLDHSEMRQLVMRTWVRRTIASHHLPFAVSATLQCKFEKPRLEDSETDGLFWRRKSVSTQVEEAASDTLAEYQSGGTGTCTAFASHELDTIN